MAEARQLGSLHERMAYMMAIMQRDGSAAVSNDLWHAIWDMDTLVRRMPDVAFHTKTDKIVPATHRYAKHGLEYPRQSLADRKRKKK